MREVECEDDEQRARARGEQSEDCSALRPHEEGKGVEEDQVDATAERDVEVGLAFVDEHMRDGEVLIDPGDDGREDHHQLERTLQQVVRLPCDVLRGEVREEERVEEG